MADEYGKDEGRPSQSYAAEGSHVPSGHDPRFRQQPQPQQSPHHAQQSQQPQPQQHQTQQFASVPYGAPSDQPRPAAHSAAPYGAPQAGPVQGTAPYGAAQPPYGASQHAAAKSHSSVKTFFIAFAGAAVACVLALGGFALMGALRGDSGSSTQLGSSLSTTIDVQGEDATLPEVVAQKALPSVAAIDVYTNAQSQSFGFGMGSGSSSNELTQSSLGSGVVLTADGYIVTNYHVIEGGTAFKVTVGGETYDAEVVGYDASSDLAVIKAKNASGLTAIEVGDSDAIKIGEWVMSIGSPFGLEQSVATGIVSATSRSQIMDSQTGGTTTIYTNLIQTDAAINPGNSGGALVDSDGKLIGINTLITSYSGNYSGVGFAIPVNYAMDIAQQIIDGKTPTHAQLGVTMTSVNSSMAKRYGLSATSGAYVTSVSSGSGAAEAGIEVGDIITKFDGKDVASASDLTIDVRSKNPGDKVSIEVNRNGETKTFEVTLGSDEKTPSLQQSLPFGLSLNSGNDA